MIARLAARLGLLFGLHRGELAPVRSWRDPGPALCLGRPVHTGRALSTGESP